MIKERKNKNNQANKQTNKQTNQLGLMTPAKCSASHWVQVVSARDVTLGHHLITAFMVQARNLNCLVRLYRSSCKPRCYLFSKTEVHQSDTSPELLNRGFPPLFSLSAMPFCPASVKICQVLQVPWFYATLRPLISLCVKWRWQHWSCVPHILKTFAMRSFRFIIIIQHWGQSIEISHRLPAPPHTHPLCYQHLPQESCTFVITNEPTSTRHIAQGP